MDNSKLDIITNLFEEKEIRSIWNSEKEDYFFSVVDVVSALTDSNDPAHYWRTLKSRMIQEGNETVTNCDTFKLKAKDGKMRNTDMLTNEIYKGWSGMKASEYKKLKGLRKESLRDNMTDIEVLLTDLGEITTRDIAQTEHPQGFNENMNVAKRGGQVANDARRSYEKQTKKSAISKNNALNYKYVDDEKLIEDKKTS